jgi:hypothetical protein
MRSLIGTAAIVVTELSLRNGIRSLEGVMKTDTLAGQETIQPTAGRETTESMTAHATTESMTGQATRTSMADQAMTNPTVVPAR